MYPDATRYLGIPYVNGGRTRSGVDCWGIVKLIYSECLGIEIKDLGEEDIEYSQDWAKDGEDYFMKHYSEKWQRVDEPKPFDVVLIRNGRGIVDHCGLVLDSQRFIQCLRAGVVVSRLSVIKKVTEGFFRYKHV